MISWERVDELRSEIGEDVFGEIVEVFLEEIAEAMARLQQGAALESLKADLHFVKGCALNLGFRSLAGACAEAEASPGAETTAAVVDIYERSKSTFLDRVGLVTEPA